MSPGFREKGAIGEVNMFRNSKMSNYDKKEDTKKNLNKKQINKPYFVSYNIFSYFFRATH